MRPRQAELSLVQWVAIDAVSYDYPLLVNFEHDVLHFAEFTQIRHGYRVLT